MRETAERRVKMLEFLCERRKTKVCDLAAEFGVSRRTVHNDLSVLSCSYPITLKRGTNGGVRIADGFRLGRKYFTDSQLVLLEKVSETLTAEEQAVMQGILKTFKKPS